MFGCSGLLWIPWISFSLTLAVGAVGRLHQKPFPNNWLWSWLTPSPGSAWEVTGILDGKLLQIVWNTKWKFYLFQYELLLVGCFDGMNDASVTGLYFAGCVMGRLRTLIWPSLVCRMFYCGWEEQLPNRRIAFSGRSRLLSWLLTLGTNDLKNHSSNMLSFMIWLNAFKILVDCLCLHGGSIWVIETFPQTGH